MQTDTFIPNSFQTPNPYIDQIMSYLTPEEFKVLIYATRRIFGFQKRQDRIAVSQFIDGITTRDGRVLDQGTGLSRFQVRKALSELSKVGILKQLEQARPDRTAALYSLELDPSQVNFEFLKTRLENKRSANKKRIDKARRILNRVSPQTPLEQGKPTDPVQGKLTGGLQGHTTDTTITRIQNPVESQSVDSFSETQHLVERLTGLPIMGKNSIEAIRELSKMGATEQDIKDALTWLEEQGRPLRTIGMLVGPTRTAIGKRQAKPGKILLRKLKGIDGTAIHQYSDGTEERVPA